MQDTPCRRNTERKIRICRDGYLNDEELLKSIQPSYSEPGGIVWKVRTDPEGQHLVVEHRDAAKRKTAISVIRLHDGKMLYTIGELPESWWIALREACHGKLILHGYKEASQPEPAGVYVYSLEDGKMLWQNRELMFISFPEKEEMILAGAGKESWVFYKARASDGKLREHATEAMMDIPETGSGIFPLFYHEDNDHYKTIRTFLEGMGYVVTGPVEYLEHADKLILSFYIYENTKLTNFLIVVNGEGEELLKDILIAGSDGFGVSTFFISGDKLIYVQNKTRIAIVKIG